MFWVLRWRECSDYLVAMTASEHFVLKFVNLEIGDMHSRKFTFWQGAKMGLSISKTAALVGYCCSALVSTSKVVHGRERGGPGNKTDLTDAHWEWRSPWLNKQCSLNCWNTSWCLTHTVHHSQGVHADPCLLLKAPTIYTSEPDQGVMEEGVLILMDGKVQIFFYLKDTSQTQAVWCLGQPWVLP